MGKHRVYGLYLLFIFVALDACLGCFEEEKLGLLEFKRSLTDSFSLLSSWTGNDCCQWKGIGCHPDTRRVVKIDLRANTFEYYDEYGYYYEQLGGEVNDGLAKLKHLTHLDLSRNYFGGRKIPEFIGTLKQLRYLNLSDAGFNGTIPSNLGNLTNLKFLDLSGNGGNLVVDDMEWISRLPALQRLNLSNVYLGSARNLEKLLYTIPLIDEVSLSRCYLSNDQFTPLGFNTSGRLSKIRRFDLSFNTFQGSLPFFLKNLTSLEFLNLSGYNLNDPKERIGNLLDMIPSLLELHLSFCQLQNSYLSPTHRNSSMFSNIRRLDLSSNSLEGEFPSLLINMSSLGILDISSNFLNSSIPVMDKVVHLDLSFNYLNSSIPVMKNLLRLNLQGNQFRGIDQIGVWNQCRLRWLDVSSNDLQEIIGPSADVSKCVHFDLEVLNLEDINFTGVIPESLGRLIKLKQLRLSRNRFIGSIPGFFANFRMLEILDLESNMLTGFIPSFLGNLTSLTEISLQSNQLEGPIPVSLGRLSLLEGLYLQHNHHTGPIPESLGRLTSLKILSMRSNVFEGKIPSSLGQLTKLIILDISNNSLEGVVSEAHFANMSRLKFLNTTSNFMLTFSISPEWIPPFQLQYLHLGSCKIASEFPRWIRTQKNLNELTLSNTSISGPLPLWLRRLPLSSTLDLSHNLITGPLTNLPFQWTSYGRLFLQNNLFNGSIPESLCEMTYIGYLDMSRNRLSGELPKCLDKLRILDFLILSSNMLSGIVPRLPYSQLTWLQLNNNNFHGEFPLSTRNCTNLQVLDLGENEFSGRIPEWVGEDLRELVILRLQRNNFSGSIPQKLCQNSYLQILDFALNGLNGTIPRCFGELSGMITGVDGYTSNNYGEQTITVVIKGMRLEYRTNVQYVISMDLSSNNLVGEIPKEITSLVGLIGLNLSHNHLTGAIPDKIGDVKSLNSLDLSANKLSGSIPSTMAALTYLSHLNLSYNNLSGRIPTGSQLQTLIDPTIYTGNAQLCGPPLPKSCSNEDRDSGATNDVQKDKDDHKKVWFYLNIMGGFATGFWGLIGVLVFKKHWRLVLFRFVEDCVDKIYVAIAVRVSKIKKGR